MPYRKKLIEVALPLEAINVASAREKSIRHGHPSTLHLWWARRPLAAARAVIFTSLVDDPDSPDALPAFVEACNKLPIGANVHANGDTPRMRLFDFIERLVTWEATTDEAILNTARELIMIATEGNPPPLLDPFAGGGSIPLEAQRLGLEAHASDLNPVAVMINKAQIEIPPRFANLPPVNPRDRRKSFAPHPLAPSPTRGEGETAGISVALSRTGGEGESERISVSPALEQMMLEISRKLRREKTTSEDMLWEALRNRKLDNRKFRRQQPVGAFVLDFYCADERLAVEVDGPIHDQQREADAQRQEILESLGIRFVRLSANQVETDLNSALTTIRAAFLSSPLRGRGLITGKGLDSHSFPSPLRGRGAGGEGDDAGGDTTWRGAAGLAADVRYYGEWMRKKAWEKIGHLYPTHNGETVIAWLWARTVKSPNPAINAHVPLVRSFILSKKKGRSAWIEPVIETVTDGSATHRIRYEVRREQDGYRLPKDEGTVNRRGGRDIITGEPMPFEYIRAEGKAGRMGAHLMAIVTEGKGGRSYYSPTDEQKAVLAAVTEVWSPKFDISHWPGRTNVVEYGLTQFADLFTPRQLVALTTFSDLVAEARAQAYADAVAAGLPDDGVPLRDGGRGALAYAEAVSVYLAFGVDKGANLWSSITSWMSDRGAFRETFARQAIPMVWDFAEANPFSQSGGNVLMFLDRIADAITYFNGSVSSNANQLNALDNNFQSSTAISTDPPYYDNIGYADLSDFFYVWMRKSLRDVYPDIFGTMLVPKEPELIASPYRHGGREAANAHFESGMLQTFSNIRRFVSHDYPLTIYYAFKQQDSEADEADDAETEDDVGATRRVAPAKTQTSSGWETFLSGVIQSGFSIDGTWPIRTESVGRANNIGANALASSIVLVCRPRPEAAPSLSRRQFVDALHRELPAALKEMQSGNIAPVDLAQASIGPGMAIYSRCSRVLEADGSAMSVRTALGLINQALDAYLAEQDGDIDPDTRFAVAWFEQFGFSEGEFGMADTLARAKNTSVAGVEAARVVTSARGRVRLIHWKEYDPGAWNPQQDKRPTVWEATHHLIERLNSHGDKGSALLLAQMPHEMAAEARNLAYRLYSICERKGWAEHARDYNALVISWAEIGTQMAALRQAREAGDKTVQPRLFD